MAEEGATQVPVSDNPEDACPRIVGKGKHYFEWINFSEDRVRCINCGQIRTRTRDKDQVEYRGTIEFPAAPVGMEIPPLMSPELVPVVPPDEPAPPPQNPPTIVAAAPPDSFAGGGASGTYENPVAAAAPAPSMNTAPSVVADNSPASAPADSGGGSSGTD